MRARRGSLGWILVAVLAVPAGGQMPPEARIHPAIPLLDSVGGNVLRTGRPVSLRVTCGDCHDVAYITAHGIHAGPGLEADGTPAQMVSSRPRQVPEPAAEMNCLLCHTPTPDDAARLEALSRGLAAWAPTATLAGTPIVRAEDGRWRWNPLAFDREGTVMGSLLALQRPGIENCGLCHGRAGSGTDEPLVFRGLGPGDMKTLSTGEVISPQRISDSGVNVAGKDSLHRPWDLHAERLLDCTNCHASQNNPAYRREAPENQPRGLIFDSRRMPLGAYLQRPSHNFMGQTESPAETRLPRRLDCVSCHDPAPTHQWLPYAERHMNALACEVCHVPALYAPAVESVDWTRLDEAGSPAVTFRGCEAGCEVGSADMVYGVEPALLARAEADGRIRLAPYNLVTSWYWVSAGGEPVDLETVRVASTGTTMEGVADRLRRLGVADPEIRGDIRAYAIHHGVAAGEWSIRDCRSCHDAESRLTRPVVLGDAAPAGVVPVPEGDGEAELAGAVVIDDEGRPVYEPRTASIGYYILGHDVVWWANVLGILAVVGTFLGVVVHAALRWLAVRSGARVEVVEGPEVYMYSAYERIWHWLQAAAILLLLMTGLEIHVTSPGLLDFALAVRLHNILGFIVLANALFAAFYHLASGEIRQYVPQPRGFFGQAITQARYYLSGIFRGEPHPFEKTPGRKLNPLQQVTYLAILNVLLPWQVVTGVLIWGLQRWPAVDGLVGGLTVLAPLHAFGAWMFAAFLLMHVYLTTTGPTPLANIQAMVFGWEALETGPEKKEAT